MRLRMSVGGACSVHRTRSSRPRALIWTPPGCASHDSFGREDGCSLIFGLAAASDAAGLDEFREGSPHLGQGLEVRAPSQVCFPTVRPFHHHEIVTRSTRFDRYSTVHRQFSPRRRSCRCLRHPSMPMGVEGPLMCEQCPDRARHLVGERHHHDIVGSPLEQLGQPRVA
jgi:hypothetical protein